MARLPDRLAALEGLLGECQRRPLGGLTRSILAFEGRRCCICARPELEIVDMPVEEHEDEEDEEADEEEEEEEDEEEEEADEEEADEEAAEDEEAAVEEERLPGTVSHVVRIDDCGDCRETFGGGAVVSVCTREACRKAHVERSHGGVQAGRDYCRCCGSFGAVVRVPNIMTADPSEPMLICATVDLADRCDKAPETKDDADQAILQRGCHKGPLLSADMARQLEREVLDQTRAEKLELDSGCCFTCYVTGEDVPSCWCGPHLFCVEHGFNCMMYFEDYDWHEAEDGDSLLKLFVSGAIVTVDRPDEDEDAGEEEADDDKRNGYERFLDVWPPPDQHFRWKGWCVCGRC